MFYAFDNIGDDSESITDNSHRVHGKFIITIISKKWFITSLYKYSLKEQIPPIN